MSQVRKERKIPKETKVDYTFLIPLLKEKAMTAEEIQAEFVKRNITVRTALIMHWLEFNTPIYDVSPGVYKILTTQDLDNYVAKQRGKVNGKQ